VSTDPIRVVLVKDHPTFRLGLKTRLELEPDLEVLGEAATGDEALDIISALLPDVAVVDLNLPGMDGVELTRTLAASMPHVRVLVLTMLDDVHVFAAVRAGAKGYLLKDADPGRIVAAIRTMVSGDTVFSAGIAERLISLSKGSGPRTFGDLSARETGVLTLLAEGLTNAEIGRRLAVTPKTVRNYVSNVISKLQAADRTDAMLRAREAGLADT
jgi:DNA-binding NarL/FixJ family response regulator